MASPTKGCPTSTWSLTTASRCLPILPAHPIPFPIAHPRPAHTPIHTPRPPQGTSVPSHFHVLRNDGHVAADDYQRLTFDLCHLNQRCTKITKDPAPTGYAHMAAYRCADMGASVLRPGVGTRLFQV